METLFLNTPKKLYLKESYPKKILAKILPPKKTKRTKKARLILQ